MSRPGTPTLSSIPPGFRLDERVVIVTGASEGIGSWLAVGLAAAGARLVLTARSEEALECLASRLPDARAVPGDITDDEHRGRLVTSTLERYGRIDGLVNNAGRLQVTTAFREDATAFRDMLELNLLAPFDLARRCAMAMRDTGGGSIVNITSMSAIVATGSTGVPSAGYCAAKAGLAHLTRELAVSGGATRSASTPSRRECFDRDDRQVEELPDFFASGWSLKRIGSPLETSSQRSNICCQTPRATSPVSRSLSTAAVPSPDLRQRRNGLRAPTGFRTALATQGRQGLLHAVTEHLRVRQHLAVGGHGDRQRAQ